MSVHTAYDASIPEPHGLPNTDTVLIYIGGDTPHVWTDDEIAAQPERYRLPVFVRSFGGVSPGTDAANALAWLSAHKVPKGTTIVLDLETLIDSSYVSAFGLAVHSGGYLVLPYGSADSIFKNPSLDGYFVAKPQATEIVPGSVATQFGYFGDHDLSWISDTVRLWDTLPPEPAPTPSPPIQEGTEMIASTPSGNGYWTVKPDGAVDSFGDAQYHGGANTSLVNGKWDGPPTLEAGDVIVGIASHPVTQGYWLLSQTGGVFSYGLAVYHGSPNVVGDTGADL